MGAGDSEKRLYPVHFCRDCGHEYHPVRLVNDGGDRHFFARDIDDAAPARPDEDDDSASDDTNDANDREIFGFLTPHAGDADFTFSDRDEDYPETWLEYDAKGNPRLKAHYRGARARAFSVAPNGKLGSGTKAWFLPGKFRFCLRCGATQGGAARDRNRLASLSLRLSGFSASIHRRSPCRLVDEAARAAYLVVEQLSPESRRVDVRMGASSPRPPTAQRAYRVRAGVSSACFFSSSDSETATQALTPRPWPRSRTRAKNHRRSVTSINLRGNASVECQHVARR